MYLRKQGCLETVASATGIVRLARHLAEGYEGDSSIKAAVDNGEQVTSKIFSLPLPKATNLLIASLTKSLNTSDLQQQISQIFLTQIQLSSVVVFQQLVNSCVAVSKDTLHVMHSHKFAVQQK